MGNLNAFLNPVYKEKTIEIDLGDRFINPETGEHEKVLMKSISQEQMQEISRASTKERKVGNKVIQDVDAIENMNRCLIESIVFPDLKDHELCVRNGTVDPVKLPPKLFLVEEYNILAQAFAKLHGIKINSDGLFEDEVGEVTKN